MKFHLILLLLVGTNQLIVSQDWKTSNQLQASGDITVITSASDNLSNTMVLGFYSGDLYSNSGDTISSYGESDLFICKYDNNANVVWVRGLGSPLNDDIQGGICTDSDNNIYISSAYRDHLKYSANDSILSTGSWDSFLAKYSPDGDVIWIRNSGTGTSQQRSTALAYTPAGDLVIAGFFRVDISFYTDSTITAPNIFNQIYYASFDPENGDFIWAKSIRTISGFIGGRLYGIAPETNYLVFTGGFVDSLGFETDTITSIDNSFDAVVFKTDLLGNVDWVRSIAGKNDEASYVSTVDPENNVYFTGFYASDTLFVDSTQNEITTVYDNLGSYDLFVAKYSTEGNLQWISTAGGISSDKLADAEFYNNEINVSGFFTGEMEWGGITLVSDGPNDQDMFTGALDTDGNFRSANSFGGRNNSSEDARSIFSDGPNLYTVIRSNSDLLVLGDSIYTASGEYHYVALGIIGCLPISIDNINAQDVQTCFGDSTGTIQILASGGFGAPWQYSIDNGLNYQDLAYFADLPAGDYPIVVIDSENCTQPGNVETVSQPDPLSIELISDQLIGDMIEIVVTAAGGSPPYTYTLQPDGIVQGFGTFTVEWNDTSSYFVEVNDLNNCGPAATDTLTTSSGIELTAPGVKLYPNPTSGVITLEMPYDGAEASLEVLSLTGQVLVRRQVYSAGGVINETVDLSNLSKGMYMIRVEGQTLRSGVVVN